MKVVILAGGYGTRISEESHLRPKPLIEIGGHPILWHIMKIYAAHDLQDFIICCGYKGYLIKEYFSNYFLHMADATFDLRQNKVEVHHPHAEPWTITLVDTGLETMTGGRLLKIKDYLDGGTFCFTYGDGVSDVNITKLIERHKHHRRLSTVTAVQPPARFGALEIDDDRVTRFVEKPKGDGIWINGGFFVLEQGIFDYLEGDQDIWEQRPLRMLAQQNQLSAYRHLGFWAAMDTMRDKTHLEELWASERAPWKVWR